MSDDWIDLAAQVIYAIGAATIIYMCIRLIQLYY